MKALERRPHENKFNLTLCNYAEYIARETTENHVEAQKINFSFSRTGSVCMHAVYTKCLACKLSIISLNWSLLVVIANTTIVTVF